MTVKVLVAYGTKNGSTEGIAQMIAAALREDGLQADVADAGGVREVAGYDAVILGGALYAGRWHSHARRFARRQAGALAGKPVWLFSSGPLDTSAEASEIPPVRQAADAARRLGARGHATFGGRLTQEAKGFIARAMVRNGNGGDFRNPQRIAQWAHAISGQLRTFGPDTRRNTMTI